MRAVRGARGRSSVCSREWRKSGSSSAAISGSSTARGFAKAPICRSRRTSAWPDSPTCRGSTSSCTVRAAPTAASSSGASGCRTCAGSGSGRRSSASRIPRKGSSRTCAGSSTRPRRAVRGGGRPAARSPPGRTPWSGMATTSTSPIASTIRRRRPTSCGRCESSRRRATSSRRSTPRSRRGSAHPTAGSKVRPIGSWRSSGTSASRRSISISSTPGGSRS